MRLRLVCGHLSRALDRAPQVRAWFRASGFDEVAFDSPDTEALTGVGVHRLAADPAAELPSGHLFTFRGS